MPSLKAIYRHHVPIGIKRLLHPFGPRECPVCGARPRRFLPFGLVPRPEAQCPVCLAMERHRLVWRYLAEETDLFDGKPKRFLHVAPEAALARRLRRVRGLRYVTCDLAAPTAMVHLDLTRMPWGAGAFDCLYCSHVLEHVPDDRAAIREMRRVLRPGGWAVVMVPRAAGPTREDPGVADPRERERLFGQADHVRVYGDDFPDRLEAAGFRVRVDRFVERFTWDEQVRYGFGGGEDIYRCE